VRDPVVDAIRELLAKLPTDRHDVGKVTSTTPLEVSLRGATGLSASRLASYTTPTIGDLVLILQTETNLVIKGKLLPGE
jgi:hypothetical protein